MSVNKLYVPMLRGILVLALLGGVVVSGGCDKNTETDSPDSGNAAEGPAGEQERPEGFTSWTITIVDDDTYTEGEITYSIVLNLTATNPTQSIDGVYTGTATAKTDTTGMVQGAVLNASALANSTALTFTLMDEAGAEGGVAPLTARDAVYSGTGNIVMAASGSGTIGAAGGGFSNTSGQPVEVTVQGSAVTFKVNISGHTYTFEGTITGNP